MLETHKDHQIQEIKCINALKILEGLDLTSSKEDIEWWLEEYEDLCTPFGLGAPGKPTLYLTSHWGVEYPGIKDFCHVYHNLKYPESDK